MFKGINLMLLLEICSLISVGYWGYMHGKESYQKIILMIFSMGFIAIIWGLFGAPKSPFRLSSVSRAGLLFIIYLLAITALITSGKKTIAIVFTLAVIVNSILIAIWKQ